MAQFLFTFSKDTRNLRNDKAKFLDHSFPFPYGGSYESLFNNGVCTVGSLPPGYELVLAEDIDDTGFFQFNLMVPDTYSTVVLYIGSATPALDPGDLLILGNNRYYEVQNAVAQGALLRTSDLVNVTTDIVQSAKNNTIIAIPAVGLYNIPENTFCPYPVGENSLRPASRDFAHDRTLIYDALPLDSYNLGDREDQSVKIVRNQVELEQIAPLLPEGCVLYNQGTGEYFRITDEFGTTALDTSGFNLLSPSRWILEGADAGIDFVNKKGLEIFDQYVNPETAFVENLPWISQIFGMDTLTDGVITPAFFQSTDPEFNTLTEEEVRCILCNSLGWVRDTNTNFDGLVQLYERDKTYKVDFIFDGSNNNSIDEGDKGIFLNADTSTVYEAIATTDFDNITLQEIGTTTTVAASPGDRLTGIIYGRTTSLSTKGLAMDDFQGNLPADAGDDKENLNLDFANTIDGLQVINYQIWQVVGEQIELNPGAIYRLKSYTEDLPTLIDPNTGFVTAGEPIGNITVIDATEWEFQVDPGIDPCVQTYYKWTELNLNFAAYMVSTVVEATQFTPENWMGYKGSRGSVYGYTVSNTLLGLTNPVPIVVNKETAITCAQTDKEFAKAKKLEAFVGAPNYSSHVQLDVLTSDKSFVNDFWLGDGPLRDYEVPAGAAAYTSQYVYYVPNNQLVVIDLTTGELFINEVTTHRFLPQTTAGKFGVGREGTAYWWNDGTEELLRFERLDVTSHLEEFEDNVVLLNESHGFYIQETTNTDVPVLLKRDGRIIFRLSGTSSDYTIMDEYPYLVTDTGNGYYKYQDLLTGVCYFTKDEMTRTVGSGCLLYTEDGKVFPVQGRSSNQIYNSLEIPLVEIGATSIENLYITEEYLGLDRYNLLDREFSFYKLRYTETDGGAVNVTKYKYLYCETLITTLIDSTDVSTETPPVSANGTADVLDLDPQLVDNGVINIYY